MRQLFHAAAAILLAGLPARGNDGPLAVDESDYHAMPGAVMARSEGDLLRLSWPSADGETIRLDLDRRPSQPVIAAMEVQGADGKAATLLRHADPVAGITLGTREGSKGRPPGMSPFNEFFDNPAQRPSEFHPGRFVLRSIRLEGDPRQLAVRLGGLEIGPFRGEWRITAYAGSRLAKIEAVVKTDRDRAAIVYELGIASSDLAGSRIAWTDTEGAPVAASLESTSPRTPQAVRHRAIACDRDGASLVVTPLPHQFFFPRDYTDNVRTAWWGRSDGDRPGLGVRQDTTGGGNFVPWFNAPPGRDVHLAMFVHAGLGPAGKGLDQMLAYTRGDRFTPMPGRITYTSHYHMAIAVAAMKAKAEGKDARTTPDFVRMFKAMNVNAVHLGEFHGDGHQFDPGPLRLPELKAMFDECRRLSDGELLMIPGEEISKFLGKSGPDRHPGHWMSLFPKPVYWILDRKPDQPLVSDDPIYGKVYRVGSAEDVQKVLEAEHGLAWTAHPRIKASSWAPDAFFDEPYFRADTFLGAAWKAMPADLSDDVLGRRALDLLDAMSNLGLRKFLPGEVDIFTLDRTHELYGHMNVNYLEVDRLPAFDGGWKSILDALRAGKFFTTTGEVLVTEFNFDGAPAGGVAKLRPGARQEFALGLDFTYPLSHVDLIVGDGKSVRRERTPMNGTRAFGKDVVRGITDLTGARWLRVEAWDVAGNGAYTQPVRIEN